MGNNESVFLANASGQDVYVLPGLYPHWPIAEFLDNISRLYVGVEELRGATAEVLQLPEALSTVRDLYEFLQVASKLLSGRIELGSRSEEAAAVLRDAFRENSILILAGNDANLKDEELLRRYLNSSGVEGLAGADTVAVLVMSGDGRQVALFDSGHDHSWIATEHQRIVRSQDGSNWDQDPDAGTVEWLVGGL